MDVRPLAMHGFACLVPTDWDLVVNKGDHRGGYLVLSAGHVPQLNLTWDRQPKTPDFRRSLASMARKLQKEDRSTMDRADELPGGRGLMARFQAADGLRHVVFLRPDPDLAWVLVLRQLVPGSNEVIRQVADSCRVYPRDAERTPWRFYQLAVDLHGFWQLTGVHHLVGMTRALWFHRPDPRKRPDGALVMRRYALAERILHGKALDDWVAEHLRRRERLVESQIANDGTFVGIADAPGTWFQRLRGQPDRRHLCAWIDQAHDRLVLQEFKGHCQPLPVLRYPGDLKDVGLAESS